MPPTAYNEGVDGRRRQQEQREEGAMGKPKVTINDVARKAGVSPACVSFVAHNRPSISPETARKVRKAMTDLGYRPPRTCTTTAPGESRRSSGSSPAVAFAVFGCGDPGSLAPIYAEVFRGASKRAEESGANLRILYPADARELRAEVDRQGVSGLVLLGADFNDPILGEVMSSASAVKVMGLPFEAPSPCDHVTYDNPAVGRLAARHLLERIDGPLAVFSSATPKTATPKESGFEGRVNAFLDESAKSGRRAESFLFTNRGATDEAFSRLLRATHPPRGIFATADSELQLLHTMLSANGMRPGTDIVLIGCNNEKFAIDQLKPKPATVDIHARDIGEKAVETLLWRVRHPGGPRVRLFLEPMVVEG